MAVPLREHDLDLALLVGVAERRAQREAVELRLGERERSLLLDRVLGRDDEERRRQHARDAVDGDLALGHRFEERRLRLRHRAVDLVDEHDVREDRARPELELARLLVVDGEAGDVRRLEIRRALDPVDGGALDRLRDRPREHGLRRPRDVLEQDVPLRRERREDERDLLPLAEHDPLDVAEEAVGDGLASLADHVRATVPPGLKTRYGPPYRSRPNATTSATGCAMLGCRAPAATTSTSLPTAGQLLLPARSCARQSVRPSVVANATTRPS